MSCDFFNNDKYILVTNLEGDASIVSLEDNMNIVKHETIETNERSNVAYCCACVPGDEGVFLVGTENKLITKFKFDPKYMEVEKLGFYKGHSNSVRHVAVSKSNKHMLSSCEDHSLRLWDYNSFEPLIIFSGHQNNATGGCFIDESTIVSCSWDQTIKVWKF